jgi:hypothetical protein
LEWPGSGPKERLAELERSKADHRAGSNDELERSRNVSGNSVKPDKWDKTIKLAGEEKLEMEHCNLVRDTDSALPVRKNGFSEHLDDLIPKTHLRGPKHTFNILEDLTR